MAVTTSNVAPNTNNAGGGQQTQQQYIQPGNTRQGTGFVNLQQFLNANQNNQLGSTIGGGINNYVSNVNNGLGTANQEFQQSMGANSYNTPQNTQYVNNTLSNVENYGQPNASAGSVGASNNALINPQAASSPVSQNDINQFSTFEAGGYNGPTQLQNAQQLSGQAQNAQNLGQATLSDAGRQELLQQFVGNQNPYQTYTQGEQNLDALLLGQQQAPLQQANQTTQGLASNVNNQIGLSQQEAQNTAAQNEQFGQNLNNVLLPNAISQVEGGINNNLSADQAAQAALLAQYQNQLGAGNGVGNQNAAQLQQLAANSNGIFTGLPTNYYGVNPDTYLSSTAPTLANVGTQANQAQLNALSQLSGNNAPSTFLPTLTTPFNINTSNGITFNNPGFESNVQAAQNAYNTALNAPISQVIPSVSKVGNAGTILSNSPAGISNNMSAQQAVNQLQQDIAQEQNAGITPLNPGAWATNAAQLQNNQINLNALQAYIQGINNKYGQGVTAPNYGGNNGGRTVGPV